MKRTVFPSLASTSHRPSRPLPAVILLLLLPACSDESGFTTTADSASPGLEASVKPDRSNLPDGYHLYSCNTPKLACNAHDPCAINPICSADKKCVPEKLMDCSDGQACTVDTCEGLGVCKNTPKSGWCLLPVVVGGPPRDGGAADSGAKDAGSKGVDYGAATTVLTCFQDGDKKPDDPCMVCSASAVDAGVKSDPTHWSSASGGSCDDGDPCTKGDYCQAGICKGTSYKATCADEYSCTDDLCDGKGGCLGNKLKSGYCLINGTCYKDKASHPSGACLTCDSAKNPAAWSPISNTCMIGSTCYASGASNPAGCGECDPAKSTSDWTVKGNTCCLISGVSYATGKTTTDGCSICDPTKSKTAWTLLTTVCKIGSTCYQSGAANPAGCGSCVPATKQTDWTVTGSTCCWISGTAYTSGQKDSAGCATCDPTKDKYGWTPLTGQCKISGVCYASGTVHTQGCAKCDPAKSQTAWTVTQSGYCVTGDKCFPLCQGACVNLDTDAKNCGTCGNACTGNFVCKAGKCTAPCVVVADLESGVWPATGWVTKASGGTVSTAAAHDGTYGLVDPDWHYALGTSTGAVGSTVTAWVRMGSSSSGRVYLGFSATASGCKSLVFADNTSEFFFQDNTGYSAYTSLPGTVSMSYTALSWYKLEVKFQASGVVKGTLYSSDGKTVVKTTSTTISGSLVGGVAIRAFSSHHVDTITVCQ